MFTCDSNLVPCRYTAEYYDHTHMKHVTGQLRYLESENGVLSLAFASSSGLEALSKRMKGMLDRVARCERPDSKQTNAK